jgi:ribonuclease HII
MSDLIVIGIDEVGRGCLAGPVAACAFIFHPGIERIAGLKDSKKLSAKQREALEVTLISSGRHGYGEASSQEIDQLGINPANFLAMRRAIENLQLDDLSPYAIVIDGNQIPPFQDMGAGRLECIIKADDTVPSVSAASVLAKVRRDRFMAYSANQYPSYGFESHAGYGSAAHMKAIVDLGPCLLHRMTFAPMTPKKNPAKKAVKL